MSLENIAQLARYSAAQQAKQAGELKCPTCGKSDCNCPEYKALKKQKGY
jgi:hypothetical protein